MNLSEEQIAELKQAFDMFDKDKGGTINSKELGYTMRAMGMNPTEGEILDLLNEFDSDSNGTIEFSEFCSMMQGKMLAVHDDETIEMTFRALDISGSGIINCKQFKQLITNIGNIFKKIMMITISIPFPGDKLTEQEAEDLLVEVDKNHDGVISHREFVKMMAFKQSDNSTKTT